MFHDVLADFMPSSTACFSKPLWRTSQTSGIQISTTWVSYVYMSPQFLRDIFNTLAMYSLHVDAMKILA